MNNDYIIVNKTDILKRIEELEKANEDFRKHTKTHNPTMAACEATLSTLKQLLSQSTPLIPEIEKAYNTGMNYGCYLRGGSYDHNDNIDIVDYITNLKLDI